MIWNPWKRIRQLERQLGHMDDWIELAGRYQRRLDRAEKVLRNIAAEEKPSSIQIVKRIAAMAREGLKQ
jgi:hypothetical protein